MRIGKCEVNIKKNSLTIGVQLVGFQSMNVGFGGVGGVWRIFMDDEDGPKIHFHGWNR